MSTASRGNVTAPVPSGAPQADDWSGWRNWAIQIANAINYLLRAGRGTILNTSVGDAAYSILPSDQTIETSVVFTAPRIWTLPAANSVDAGYEISIIDAKPAITSTNTLTIALSGADKIDGSTTALILDVAGAAITIVSDGLSNWGIKSELGSFTTNVTVKIGSQLSTGAGNYASSANYGGTTAVSGIIEVLGSSATPDSGQDAVVILQKWSNSTTNYSAGINPSLYVSNILKSGSSTARGTAGYFEAQLNANSVTSANFCEGVRGHGTINAGIAGGEVTGVVAFAGEGAGGSHLGYLIGCEAEVANNSVDSTYNWGTGNSTTAHFEACFLSTSRAAKKPFAAFMVNPFTAIGSAWQVGFFVPPASPNVADAPCVAAFRSDAQSTWGADFTGHGQGPTYAALGAPNNVAAVRANNAAATLQPSLMILNSSDQLHLGNDANITAGVLLGSSGLAVITNGDLTISAAGRSTIRSGTGAASGTQPKGSLWLRTDGAVGSTIYVSQGAGVWNAAGGV